MSSRFHPRSRRCHAGIRLFALGCALLAPAFGQPVETRSLEELFNEGAAAYGKGDYPGTVARFSEIVKQAKPGPELESIHYTIAVAKLRLGDNDGAIVAFRFYLQTYPAGSQLNDARAGLTRALVNARRIPEALAAIDTLRELRNRSGAYGIDNYAGLQGLALEVADALVQDEKAAEALRLLQSSLRREQIIERQRERNADLARLLRQASAIGGGGAMTANREALASRLKDAGDALKRLEDDPSFDVPRLLLQARCHLILDQPWEAIVLYQHILDGFPKSPDRAYALQGLVLARHAAGRSADALVLAERFVSEFPDHPLAPEIAALGGQIALEQGKPQIAETLFGSVLDKGRGELRERILFQLGIARFAGASWTSARETLDRYVAEFPQGERAENAAYRSTLTWFLDLNDVKRYEKAEKSLQAFVQTHPASIYLPDARYRLAVCQFAFQEYEKALASCIEWEKLFPDDGLLPEVLSLKGDLYKTLANENDALASYLAAASAASTDQVLSYTLGEAAKLLEARKDWAGLSEVFRTQVSRQPQSPLVLGWYYWIARAEARAGRPGQAWDFLVERIGPSLGDPRQEDVETLLQLMAQIRARQRRDDPAPIPSLAERISGEQAPLVRARLGYYDSILLRNSRKPAEADAALLAIGREYDPSLLSAPLLAETGQALLKAGDTARAAANFAALLENFGKSSYRDYAYVGQGDLALANGQAATALQAYQNAIDLAGAVHLLREATLGRARALYELGRLDEAAKLFESIAAAKEWRGEPTAISLHHLGLIAARQGDLPKANAFHQRVFVSQGRYPEWVAKSYIESGRIFEQLARPAEAATTYREMLRNERLSGRSELASARERLAVIAP